MKKKSLKLCERIKRKTCLGFSAKSVFNDYAKSGRNFRTVWSVLNYTQPNNNFIHSSPSLGFSSFISYGFGLEKAVFFPECKAAATGSCHVAYVPGGVNVSLSAHQIFWEQGLMFLAFKTHFLSSWAKWKNFVVQTHTCADLLPLYCNYWSTFLNSTDLERSKLAGRREGKEEQ